MSWLEHTSIERNTAERLRMNEPLVDRIAREEFKRGILMATVKLPEQDVEISERAALTPQQAERAWEIIYRMAGADIELRDQFVGYVTTPLISHEFRFMGSLGFGGKFYLSTQGAQINCYSEDRDDIAQAIIKSANELLKDLGHGEDEDEELLRSLSDHGR